MRVLVMQIRIVRMSMPDRQVSVLVRVSLVSGPSQGVVKFHRFFSGSFVVGTNSELRSLRRSPYSTTCSSTLWPDPDRDSHWKCSCS